MCVCVVVLLLCNDFYYLLLFSMAAMKCGMYCSLFDVMSKTKQGNCLSGLLHKLEKEKMVSCVLFFFCFFWCLFVFGFFFF